MAENPPHEAPPHPRLFVVEVTADESGDKRLLGYAITEQVGFIDLAAHDHASGVAEESGLIREGIETLFRKLDTKTYRAVGIPSERDPLGGGYQMLTSAGRATSAGGGGGGQN